MDSLLKGNTVFSPSVGPSKTKGAGPLPTAFTSKIHVYHLQANASDDVRRLLAAAMMMIGTSSGELVEEWKSYVASYTVLMIPGMLTKVNKTIHTLTQWSDNTVSSVIAKLNVLERALEGDNDQDVEDAEDAICGRVLIPGLPPVGDKLSLREGYGEWTAKVFLCHYSIVLFTIGKRIDGTDHTALTVNRPRAVKGKAHISADTAYLEGSLRLSDVSHSKLNDAWTEMSSLRAVCMEEFSLYSQSDTDVTQDILYTTMHLLKFSNMSHAKISYDFLQAHPWAVEVVALRKAIGIFLGSVNALSSYKESMIPYVKLVYGDKVDIFPRKEMEPLIACAVASGLEMSPSLRDFYTSGDFQPVVDAFLEELAQRQRIRTRKLELEEENLYDEEETEDTPVTASGLSG